MSIIYGYLNLNGKPVDRADLEMMKHSMDSWGPDGEGLWIEGNFGMGNLLYYNTPEAVYEKMPLTDASGNLVLSAGARIDNREELFAFLDIPLGQRLTMPDSALMMKAYERWGEACADHLVGDWAMAVWDRQKQKLFLARDHYGISAMYYYKGDDFFVFSSSLKGILSLPQVPKKVNEYKIAQLLVHWNEGGPTTCYLDIMRLPPAHTLTLTDGKVSTNRYWYLEHTPAIHLKNDQEYADMFLHLYSEAVRHRLRSHRPVGATLSSGLDSGSVCILAAKELAKEGKRLQAYTAVPLYDVPVSGRKIGDEGPYALALAEKLGNVDVTLCKAENIGVLEGIDILLDIIQQPIFATGNAYWLVDILKKNRDVGNGTLLTGQNGNATVSWPPLSMFRGMSKNWKKPYYYSRIYLKFLLGQWDKNLAISKEMIQRTKMKSAILTAKVPDFFNPVLSRTQKKFNMINPGASNTGDIWHEFGSGFRTEVRDPTSDLQLLKFLFPLETNDRLYFRMNFEPFFEIDILESKLTGFQSADITERLEIGGEKELISQNGIYNTLLNNFMTKVSH